MFRVTDTAQVVMKCADEELGIVCPSFVTVRQTMSNEELEVIA